MFHGEYPYSKCQVTFILQIVGVAFVEGVSTVVFVP